MAEENENRNGTNWWNVAEKIFKMIAIIATIATLWLGISTYRKAEDFKQREVSIELINEVRTSDFLIKLKTIHTVVDKLKADTKGLDYYGPYLDTLYFNNSISTLNPKQQFIDDIYYVFNVYENIAILYNHQLVNKRIMEDFICEEVEILAVVLSQEVWSKISRKMIAPPCFENFWSLSEKNACDFSISKRQLPCD